MNNNWHSKEIKEIFRLLNSSEKGLNSKEIAIRSEKYGKNLLPKGKEVAFIEIFIRQFKSPMIYILIVAGIFSAVIQEFNEAIFILVVILMNAILGSHQENKAIKSAQSIQKLIRIRTKVLRDGQKLEVDSEDLVPGDIVVLESGDKLPADVRLIEAHNLHIDEAFLTGESVSVVKNPKILKEKAPLTDRFNMCYASSMIQSGRGLGIVVATGINTEIGHIAEELSETEEAKTPLTIRMERFTQQVLYVILIFAVILGILMIIKNYPGSEIFLFVVALCVSAIPESLPIAQTVVLSIATSKMAKKNVIVKKLSSVESLGSCTVIASDKTGTLTVNQQTAKIISMADSNVYEVSGEGYNSKGNIIFNNATKKQKEAIKFLCQMGAINNEATLERKDGAYLFHGDSIDLAFLAMGLKNNVKSYELDQKFKIFGRIPYESENKYSAVFYEQNKTKYVTVKGSSETILEMCKKQKNKAALEAEVIRLAALGYRVIALATGKYNGNKKDNYTNQDIKDLDFLGFVGFIDPIRDTSKSAIASCHEAGIRVIMITGDHPLTAESIARDLNLIKGEVIIGDKIEEVAMNSKTELIKLINENNVFARVSPMQKAIIVETLEEQGEFVAVTGDGINDAPALKKANIGVAMGSGTDVAKDVGTMIITDDNFLSIVSAVEEGRFAYNNIRKVTYLLISTAFAECLLFIMAIIFNLPPPFTTVQILWINLVTNGIQDIALAFEKGEKGVMKEKPRATNERLFDKLLIQETLVSGIIMFILVFIVWVAINYTTAMPIPEARNFILLLMVILQNIHAFNCRSEKYSAFKIPFKNNPLLIGAILFALLLHIVFMNVPFLQGILTTNPVSWQDFIYILFMALPLLFALEIFKYGKRKIEESKRA